ncbi:MAG TPA: flagellin, partial [Aurantimonas sp.]
ATGTFSTAVNDIDISVGGVTSGQVQAYIKVVDEALSQVTTAASSLGAVQNRIEMQTNFVSKLMDTIDKGVGTLVDADMTEESTRLKALQTQQQLGVQALSIANSSSQSLLSLFR